MAKMVLRYVNQAKECKLIVVVDEERKLKEEDVAGDAMMVNRFWALKNKVLSLGSYVVYPKDGLVHIIVREGYLKLHCEGDVVMEVLNKFIQERNKRLGVEKFE